MRTYNIAVIGLGKITQDQHLPVIAKNPRFKLAATVSQRGLAEPGVPTFKTTTEMLKALPQIDAVAICTPPYARHAIARLALDAGKHLLLEKPTTTTTSELTDLIAHAAAKKCVIFTTWHSQYNPAVDEAKRLLVKADIRRLEVIWKEDVRRWHPGQEWIWQAGGFGVCDPGINALSIVTRIMPQPIFMRSAELTVAANRETPIAAKFVFSMPPSVKFAADGASQKLTGELDWRQTGPQTWNITVETADGTLLELTEGGSKLAVNGKLSVAVPMQEYERIYDRFAELLDSGANEIDVAPMHLMADAFLVGKRVETEPFIW